MNNLKNKTMRMHFGMMLSVGLLAASFGMPVHGMIAAMKRRNSNESVAAKYLVNAGKYQGAPQLSCSYPAWEIMNENRTHNKTSELRTLDALENLSPTDLDKQIADNKKQIDNLWATRVGERTVRATSSIAAGFGLLGGLGLYTGLFCLLHSTVAACDGYPNDLYKIGVPFTLVGAGSVYAFSRMDKSIQKQRYQIRQRNLWDAMLYDEKTARKLQESRSKETAASSIVREYRGWREHHEGLSRARGSHNYGWREDQNSQASS